MARTITEFARCNLVLSVPFERICQSLSSTRPGLRPKRNLLAAIVNNRTTPALSGRRLPVPPQTLGNRFYPRTPDNGGRISVGIWKNYGQNGMTNVHLEDRGDFFAGGVSSDRRKF